MLAGFNLKCHFLTIVYRRGILAVYGKRSGHRGALKLSIAHYMYFGKLSAIWNGR